MRLNDELELLEANLNEALQSEREAEDLLLEMEQNFPTGYMAQERYWADVDALAKQRDLAHAYAKYTRLRISMLSRR